MSILNKISYFQNRKDEIPNQELAKELAKSENKADIKEIADNLWNNEKNIQSDCIKVLYEIGYIRPILISDYVNDYVKLLKSKNNRMVWGSMIALSTISDIKSKEVWEHLDEIIEAIDKGSVITIVSGIKALSKLASVNEKYNAKIFPYLLNHLNACRIKDLALTAEHIFYAVNEKNKVMYIDILEKRVKESSSKSQISRVNKIIKNLSNHS